MANCQDVNRLLTAYLDAEVGEGQRRDVEVHLAACVPCRHRAKAEATARRVLMVRARSLSVQAPSSLRQRCAALAPRSRRLHWWAVPGWRRASLASASALAMVFVVVLTYGVASHSPTLLAAELSLDHAKCFAFFEPHTGPADPDAVARQLASDYGWQLRVPASLPSQHLTLLGARRCLSTDGQVAHVLYRHEGRPVSLFMMPRTTRPERKVAIAGRVASIWSHGDTTYVLLGDESEREMQAIAWHFKSAL